MNIMGGFWKRALSQDTTDDHFGSYAETAGLINSLYINLILFTLFMVFFEVNRHMKSTYLKRATKKFKRSHRVPPCPSGHPLAWISSILAVGDEDLLRMVGLDGYMLVRYINVCFRMSVFYSMWGLLVLAPVYSLAPGNHVSWNKFTLANIPNNLAANQLWVPAVFAYIFSMYFCHLMYAEYKNFVLKRIQYLIQGDPDTPSQTYYTLMVEKVPTTLRSAPALEAFFEKLFPGDVYSVEVALDLNELESVTMQRRDVRDDLEKAIALWKATGNRPTKWINKTALYNLPEPVPPVADSSIASAMNMVIVDAISYLSKLLEALNDSVRVLQLATFEQRQKVDEQETQRQQNLHGKFEAHATLVAGKFLSSNVKTFESVTQTMSQIFGSVGPSASPVSALASDVNSDKSESLYNTEAVNSDKVQKNMQSNSAKTNISISINGTGSSQKIKPPANTPSRKQPLGTLLTESRSADTLHPLSPPRNTSAPHIIDPLDGTVHNPLGVTVSLDDLVDNADPLKTPKPMGNKSTSLNCLRVQSAPTVKMSHARRDAIQPTSHTTRKYPKHSKRNQEWKRDGGEEMKGEMDEENTESATQSMLNLSMAIGGGVGGLAKEGLKTASIATRGALRGVLEGIRAVELLTVGAYYKTSSTAFVTMRSRQATISAHQLFLSHVHYSMVVKAAPNPKDCIWENISIPSRQVNMRRAIADGTLIIGAVFWSIVVGFITAISNLESISKEIPWINTYRNTVAYEVLNNYLAVALLLVLLSLLPMIFDLIARSYEGLKLESEIQNSIMTRYFYYQLANVFVSVGLGSLASSLHLIILNPSSILSILGTSLPSLSIYFTNLVIVKTFTAVPLELLRIYPLLQMLSVRMCLDRNKCTIRELKTGAFANPPIRYGWIYPNLLMVLMILSTYCCISPLLSPVGMLFYAFAYLLYKYQLLYVYINDYQSGGYMWYAVFNGSMVALIAGVLVLLGYLGIREVFFSGPFYLLAPLPLFLSYFWYKCEDRFKAASMSLSLESAIDLDREEAHKIAQGYFAPHHTFRPDLFRQPSLAEGPMAPQAYRKVHSFTSPFRSHNPFGESNDHTPMKDQNPYKKSNPYGTPLRDDSGQVEGEDYGEGDGGGYRHTGECYVNSTHRTQENEMYNSNPSTSGGMSVSFAANTPGEGRNSETRIPFSSIVTPVSAVGRNSHVKEKLFYNFNASQRDVSDSRMGSFCVDAEGQRSAGEFNWMTDENYYDASDSEDEMDIDVHEILDFPRDHNFGSISNSNSNSRTDEQTRGSRRESFTEFGSGSRTGSGTRNSAKSQESSYGDMATSGSSMTGLNEDLFPMKSIPETSSQEMDVGVEDGTVDRSRHPLFSSYSSAFSSRQIPSSSGPDSALLSPLLSGSANPVSESRNVMHISRDNKATSSSSNKQKSWSLFRRYGSTDESQK